MRKVIFAALLLLCSVTLNAGEWLRVNLLGYLPQDVKVAVYMSNDSTNILGMTAQGELFQVVEALSGKVVYSAPATFSTNAEKWGMKRAARLDFSEFSLPGGYYIKFRGAKSPAFKIGADIYNGLSDYMLTYMRQQRCGDNPYNNAPCHTHDGYIVDHPTRSGEHIDATGGWHDATDYLQYQTTSATACYHMLFAYMEQKDKSVFKDEYDATGRKGSNGIPDILDEAKWGLDWLVKMNPEPEVMFAQIADDRDHAGFRFPQLDSVDYGWGKGLGRPVYFVTGKPQGLGKYINRTTGVASVAGKFASTFAMGAATFKSIDPEFAAKLTTKAEQAYAFALTKPGNTQTACLVSPYFYEEDTYTDDVELAAATFYNYTKAASPLLSSLSANSKWLKEADYWGELEPISPWMELGRGRHYQFYPFINLGHYYLASSKDEKIAKKYTAFMKEGLQDLLNRGEGDPFLNGIPYIWCSNNLTSAAITQARLYNQVTGDESFLEMEAALRDWLFGCNPWGTTMISGYPAGAADVPTQPHSSYVVELGEIPYAGLIDGPVYRTVFMERAGQSLTHPDVFEELNQGIAVYHDDVGDYASNEPTMDGTAGLTFYFAAMENKGREQSAENGNAKLLKDAYGATVRVNPTEKSIYLVFTADSNFNGAETILNTLKKAKVKGSFFLTGNCLRMDEHKDVIEKIINEEHYIGGHSDSHMLYANWGNRDSLIVSYNDILKDLEGNAAELAEFGVTPEQSRWFLPPYEYYNKESVFLAESMGYRVVNYTPGTATPADYTTPDMPNYKSSQTLIDSLYKFEIEQGLNGAIILIHPGIEESRTDRLYNRLGEIIKYLRGKGYNFKSFKDIK